MLIISFSHYRDSGKCGTVLLLKKFRQNVVKLFAWGHAGRKWQSVNSSSDQILNPFLFSTALNIATNIKKNVFVVLFVKQMLIKILNFV